MRGMSLPHILLGDSVVFALDYEAPCTDRISLSTALECCLSRLLSTEAYEIVAEALDTVISLCCVSTHKYIRNHWFKGHTCKAMYTASSW